MKKYNQAICEATGQLLASDESVYVMGLGAPDPKGIFGTTVDLCKTYPTRVLDMPASENAMTGVAIGSALVGMRPIMTHQRVDFFLLGLDQLINNASKAHAMFGDQYHVPLVIRLIIGRGWGQGPQHSQSLLSLFAHIPGLKVVLPSNPYDAKGLLIAATQDNHPVVYIEHRWLHNIEGEVPDEMYTVPLDKAKIVQEGSDITLITCSHTTLEAYQVGQKLKDVSIEIVDLRTINPFDMETVLASVKKTGRALILEPDWLTCGIAAEIATQIRSHIEIPIERMGYPDKVCPASWAQSNHFYPTIDHYANKVRAMLGLQLETIHLENTPLDVPDNSFTGPF